MSGNALEGKTRCSNSLSRLTNRWYEHREISTVLNCRFMRSLLLLIRSDTNFGGVAEKLMQVDSLFQYIYVPFCPTMRDHDRERRRLFGGHVPGTHNTDAMFDSYQNEHAAEYAKKFWSQTLLYQSSPLPRLEPAFFLTCLVEERFHSVSMEGGGFENCRESRHSSRTNFCRTPGLFSHLIIHSTCLITFIHE